MNIMIRATSLFSDGFQLGQDRMRYTSRSDVWQTMNDLVLWEVDQMWLGYEQGYRLRDKQDGRAPLLSDVLEGLADPEHSEHTFRSFVKDKLDEACGKTWSKRSEQVMQYCTSQENQYSDLQVMESAAGYYVGTIFTDEHGFEGPGSRDSEYFTTKEKAQRVLDNWDTFEAKRFTL